MLGFIERSTIKLLSKRGNTPTQISHALGRDPKTVKRVLTEPTDLQFERRKRDSLVDAYEADIIKWIDDQIPVTVMLSLARNKAENPYSGGKSIFYQRVREIRQQLKAEKKQAVWRFETLPGEYLQVDWGETRKFPFTASEQKTRYCFVCRLKYSRFIYASFQDNMRFETLVRCLLRGFSAIGGVPWVVLFDNMRTVTSGRNSDESPIWVPRFRQFASEIGFHPELCDRYAPNQKGSVENGVKFVKGNFLPGRTFRNDEDLAGQLEQWLVEKNHNKSQAHGQIPAELLNEEQGAFDPLTETSESYGLLYLLRVSPESVIRFQTNCYSVPEDFIGQTLTVRVAQNALRIYHDGQLVARHQRSFAKRQWIRDLCHYQKTLEIKPKARVMAYREQLLALGEPTDCYIAQICRRDRDLMNQQILWLYTLLEVYGHHRFSQAVGFCHREQVYGAQYVELMLRKLANELSTDAEMALAAPLSAVLPSVSQKQPVQREIDRDLTVYDTYTHR